MYSKLVPVVIVFVLLNFKHGGAQDEAFSDLFAFYADIEQKLQAIRAGAAQLKDNLQFYTFEVDKVLKNDVQTEVTDISLAAQLSDSQMKRDVDLAKLLRASNLWGRNFRIVNKTLTNLKSKVVIGQPVMKYP
ncbi:unnamed protein product [Orchesella dallaii]|uniref:Uncharacterized protein n=1 Tax=Orchesella dallaii TaxID=48710 RepID=A0ABP1QW47_9HEXA